MNDTILQRVTNLLNKTVANGCTEEEAAAAVSLATKLLLKYNLDLAAVNGFNQAKTPLTHLYISCQTGYKAYEWQSQLGAAIARVTLCNKYLIMSHSQTQRQLLFIGTPDNLAVCNYFYHYLLFQILKWQSLAINVKQLQFKSQGWRSKEVQQWKLSYCVGMVRRITERLIAEWEREIKTNDTTNVCLRLFSANDNYAAETFQLYPPTKTTQDLFNSAVKAGYQDGNAIDVPLGNYRVTDGVKALTDGTGEN